MFGGTRAGKESCSMLSLVKICSYLGNLFFNQLCGRFRLNAKVEWQETAQRMIDEERQH